MHGDWASRRCGKAGISSRQRYRSAWPETERDGDGAVDPKLALHDGLIFVTGDWRDGTLEQSIPTSLGEHARPGLIEFGEIQ